MSISRRVYLILGIMVLLISAELTAVWFTVQTLSAVRAYVGGEGLWSKAEKDAVYHLEAYGRTRDPREYQDYLAQLSVPLGDREVRLEMGNAHPDYDREYRGFLQGGNYPDDIPLMISLFQRFNRVSYIHDAIVDWSQGDALLAQIQRLGAQLDDEIRSGRSTATVKRTLAQIEDVNTGETVLENRFSFTLGAGSRWLKDVVLTILFGAALTVELTGVLLTMSVTRGISNRLNAMLGATERISKGDFGATLDETQADELGRLGAALNRMSRDIERAQRRAETAMRVTEAALRDAQRVAHIGSWEWEMGSDSFVWSKELLRLYEIPHDRHEGTYAEFIGLIHPDDRARVDEAIKTGWTTHEMFSADYRILLPSRAERWLCVQGTVEVDPRLGTSRVLGTALDITERKRYEDRLEYLAQHDPLTGLPNRTLFIDRLRQAIALAHRNKASGAVLFLDLDHFKDINDTFGHAAGDRLLVLVAERLKRGTRDIDTVTRTGGDEFLLIMNGLADESAAAVVGNAILHAFDRPFVLEGRQISITASIGLSIFPRDGVDGDALVRLADAAMYQAKQQGRNSLSINGAVALSKSGSAQHLSSSG